MVLDLLVNSFDDYTSMLKASKNTKNFNDFIFYLVSVFSYSCMISEEVKELFLLKKEIIVAGIHNNFESYGLKTMESLIVMLFIHAAEDVKKGLAGLNKYSMIQEYAA